MTHAICTSDNIHKYVPEAPMVELDADFVCIQNRDGTTARIELPPMTAIYRIGRELRIVEGGATHHIPSAPTPLPLHAN